MIETCEFVEQRAKSNTEKKVDDQMAYDD